MGCLRSVAVLSGGGSAPAHRARINSRPPPCPRGCSENSPITGPGPRPLEDHIPQNKTSQGVGCVCVACACLCRAEGVGSSGHGFVFCRLHFLPLQVNTIRSDRRGRDLIVTRAQKPYGGLNPVQGRLCRHAVTSPCPPAYRGTCQLVRDTLCNSAMTLTLHFPADSLREYSSVFKKQQDSFPKHRRTRKGRFNTN